MKPRPRAHGARVIPITRNAAVYSAEETAYALSLSRKTIYNWLRNGTLPGFKSGNRWVIPKRRLEKWVDSLTRPPITPHDPKQTSRTESTKGKH